MKRRARAGRVPLVLGASWCVAGDDTGSALGHEVHRCAFTGPYLAKGCVTATLLAPNGCRSERQMKNKQQGRVCRRGMEGASGVAAGGAGVVNNICWHCMSASGSVPRSGACTPLSRPRGTSAVGRTHRRCLLPSLLAGLLSSFLHQQ
jgi:hypothetical protein